MGGSSYSDDVYKSRIDHHIKTKTSAFMHDTAVRTGKAHGLSPLVDPAKLNAAGKNVRESFDSDAHPNSRAVAVAFDVTGSMGTLPKKLVLALDKLMAGLTKEGFLPDPHILFAGIGDATCDRYPSQIGQFESGNEIDEALTSIILESGGGGQLTESYEAFLYYMARHTDLDCLNKRGLKGFLFITGDETPYSFVKRGEVKRLFGDDIQEDIPFETILEEVREKFEVYWIYPREGGYANDTRVTKMLQDTFGQNFLWLENIDDICELIISHIAAAEGFNLADIRAGLTHVGSTPAVIGRVTTAVAKWTPPANSAVATASSHVATSGIDSVDRL